MKQTTVTFYIIENPGDEFPFQASYLGDGGIGVGKTPMEAITDCIAFYGEIDGLLDEVNAAAIRSQLVVHDDL